MAKATDFAKNLFNLAKGAALNKPKTGSSMLGFDKIRGEKIK